MPPDAHDLTPSRIELLRRAAEQRADFVDLSSSNPTAHGLLFPPEILRASAERYWEARRYSPHPKGALAAREAIAAYYLRRSPPLPVSPERIFITASTSEAYALLFALLAMPGDNVLAPIPAYPLFSHLAALREVHLTHYLLTPPADGANWQLDAAALEGAGGARTRAILVISPHNPTGHVLAAPLAREGLEHLPIIADEVFCDFPYAVRSVPPVGTLMPDATVFHLNGISKMFALPDLKLGWIALTGPNAAAYSDRLELLNDTLLGANMLSQHMLPALFDQGGDFQRAMQRRVRETISHALATLQRIPGVSVSAPQGGTTLFPQFTDRSDEEELVAELLDAGLFAQPGYFYDEERGCHLVISAMLEPVRLGAAIERMRAALVR